MKQTSILSSALLLASMRALAAGASPKVTGERRQAVSVTVETAYDDWTVSEVAKVLGKQQDASYFMNLAHNYQNVWNPAIKFMSPKSCDGRCVERFDPKLGGDGLRDRKSYLRQQ